MPNRRKFIKGTGLLTGALAIPSLRSTQPEVAAIDFLKAKTDDELFALVRKQLLIQRSEFT